MSDIADIAGVANNGSASQGIRHYTEDEDKLIFNTFWNIAERQNLARRLERPMRGITYRFYHILKSKGMTPEDYIAQKGVSKLAADGTLMMPLPRRGRPRKHFRWDDAADIRLWRLSRSSGDIKEIARQLGCPSEEICRQRLSYLEAKNAAEIATLKLTSTPSASSIAAEPDTDSEDLSESSLDNFPENHLESRRDMAERIKGLEERVWKLDAVINTTPPQPQEGLDGNSFLAAFAQLVHSAQEADSLRAANSEIEADRRRLLETLETERAAMRREREEMSSVYADLEGVLHTFMNLSSIDKLRVLGDFSTRLEATVDRFGNVVNTRMTLG